MCTRLVLHCPDRLAHQHLAKLVEDLLQPQQRVFLQVRGRTAMAPGGKVAHPLVWLKFLQVGEGCFSLISSFRLSTLPTERLRRCGPPFIILLTHKPSYLWWRLARRLAPRRGLHLPCSPASTLQHLPLCLAGCHISKHVWIDCRLWGYTYESC